MKPGFSINIFLLSALCGLLSLMKGQAYRYGAGGCVANMAAVGPPHRLNSPPTFNTKVTSGSLPQGGFTVTIDSKAIAPRSTTNIVINKYHVITIKAASKKFFRGFLIRVGMKTPSALKPFPNSPNVQVAGVCPSFGAVGLTHKWNTTKVAVSGELLLQRVGKVALDITVVVQNRQRTSVFYYSGFTLNGVKA